MSPDRHYRNSLKGRSHERPLFFQKVTLMFDQPILLSAKFSGRFDDVALRLLCMKRESYIAEARAAGLSSLIHEIWQFGWVSRTSLLGPVIQTRSYAPQAGGRDSGQIIQSALLVPEGLGVVIWDTEEFVELADIPDGLEAQAPLRQIPFEQCNPAWRALLCEHIEPLVERLFDLLVRT